MTDIEFINYDTWLEGFFGYSDYITDELTRIQNNLPKT